MSYSLKLEHPHFPEGHEFGINDVGLVKNGGSIELNEDQERAFVASRGMTVEDAFKNNGMVSVSGSSALDAGEMEGLLPTPAEEGALPAGTEPAPYASEDTQTSSVFSDYSNTTTTEENEGVTNNG